MTRLPNLSSTQVGGIRNIHVTAASREGMGTPVPAHEVPTAEVRPAHGARPGLRTCAGSNRVDEGYVPG